MFGGMVDFKLFLSLPNTGDLGNVFNAIALAQDKKSFFMKEEYPVREDLKKALPGPYYQVLVALSHIFIALQNNEKFNVMLELAGVGALDDVVIDYFDDKRQNISKKYFLQLKHSCDNTNSSRRFKHQAHTNSLIPQELLQHPILPKTRKNTIAQSSQNPKPTRSKSNDLKSYHNPSSHRLTEIESLHIRSTNQPFRLLTRRVNDKPHYAYILPSVIDPLINLSSKILQKPQFAKLPKTKEYKKYPLSLYKKSKHKHIENTKSRLIDLALLNKKIFGL